jgi:hypothetical protein
MPTDAEYEAMIGSLGWDGLRELWEAIQRRETPGWDEGKAFEYLVLRAFQLDGAHVRWPYRVRLFEEDVEQIDGVIYCSGLSLLVESKDLAGRVAIEPIAKLRNQLQRRPASTLGIVFSHGGFTEPALMLAQFISSQNILLWSGDEVEYALQHGMICEFLTRKYRFCIERGLPSFNIRAGELA